MKKIQRSLILLALALLATHAPARLVGLYTFDRADPLEATIGAPALEGVIPSNGQPPAITNVLQTISLVSDAAVLGGRTGAVSVPSRSTLAIPNPGLRKDWTIVLPFYCPASAGWRCFFQFAQKNNGDGSLFIRNDTDIGASSYTGVGNVVGEWHQLTVSCENGTATVWYDRRKLDQTRGWTLPGNGLLYFSLDESGEDATMYLDDIRLYDETSPAEVFPDGVSEGPVVFDPFEEKPYSDDFADFSRTPDEIVEDLPYRVYVFRRHGSFEFMPSKKREECSVLLVGGGGAGGMLRGGGGGGGAVVHETNVTFLAQTYAATVGAGGVPDIHRKWWSDNGENQSQIHPGPSTAATCGGASSVSAPGGTVLWTAPGGGGGGNFNYAGSNIPAEGYGLDGASGGGASGLSTQPGQGAAGLGHAGGEASTDGDNSGGGGGGAGGPGAKGSLTVPGAGGSGVANSITGAAVVYGGGGGGSSCTLPGGLGGVGGGGNGVPSDEANARNAACGGVDGLGGGGGGGSGKDNLPNSTMGGRGGDGAVILRVYLVSSDDPEPALSLATAEVGFTNATFDARLLSLGNGGSSASVVFRLSANADMSSPFLETNLASGAASVPALFAPAVATLRPDSTYYAQLSAENDLHAAGASPVVPFSTLLPVPVRLSEISAEPAADGSETVSVTALAVEEGAVYSVSFSLDGEVVRQWTGQTGPGTFSISCREPGNHSASVAVSSSFIGDDYEESRTTTFETGRSRVLVTAWEDHCSAATAVRVHAGDTIVLPELPEGWSYRVLHERMLSLDGLVLTALEPAVAGVQIRNADTPEGTMAVLVLPEAIGNGSVYVFDEKSSTSEFWTRASSWEKVGSASNDSWPRDPDDVAVIPFYDTTGDKYVSHESDFSVGGILFGNFRDVETTCILQRHQKAATSNVAFERTDGEPAFVKVTPNTAASRSQTLRLGGYAMAVECVSSVETDSCSSPKDDTLNRGKITYSSCTVHIPAGKYWSVDGIPGYYINMGGTIGPPKLTGEGTFWKKGMGGVTFENGSLSFEGLLLDTSHGHLGGFNRAGPIYWKAGVGTNISVTVAGWVHPQLGNPSESSNGYGWFRTGWQHGYGDPSPHPGVPWTPQKTMTMRGGLYTAYAAQRGEWGYGVHDVRLFERLVVGPGMAYVKENEESNSNGNPVNHIEWSSLGHEEMGTLVIYDPSRRYVAATTTSTNTVTYIKGHDAFLVGQGRDGDCLVRDVYPIIPWIVSPTSSDDSSWRNTMFASFDADGRLSRPVWNNTALDAVASPFSNAYLWDKTIEISSNVVVNSLFMNNSGKNKWLGEKRKLTITSGGLVLHNGNTAIGQPGRTDNGLLVLGDAEHPAYVFAKSSNLSSPNQIWAAVTAPGGFVSGWSGALVLGGDQTGIASNIVVNAGVLTLGSAALACELAEGLEVVVRSGAKLVLPHADALETRTLRIDAAGGAPGTVEIGADTVCEKIYVRDWPASPEWKALPRGTYGSSASNAEYKDDRLFSGTGVIEILSDEVSGPSVANLALVTCDDRSATISFDLWPGFGAERVDVYALVPADGEGEVSTNLIYSSEAPADGRFEGTLTGLSANTAYTARLLAVNVSRGVEFSAESPDALEFETVSFDPTPLVVLESASETGPGGVTLPWTLVRAGSGREIVSIRLWWAESAAALGDPAACAFVDVPAADWTPGNHATALVPLRPDTSFYAMLVAANDGASDNVCTSGPLPFATAPENLPGDRALVLGSCVRTDAGLTVVVSAPAGEPAFPDVYAVWGARHAGENMVAWDCVPLRVGAMGTDASTLSAFIPAASLGDAVYVRFVGVPADDVPCWSRSLFLPDHPVDPSQPPKVGVGSVAPGGNDATLSAWVLSAGSNSGDGLVDISLEYALDPDAFGPGSQAKRWTVPFADDAPTGAVAAVRIGNLRAERRYYARFVAVNDAQQTGAGDVFTFDTLAGDGGSVGASDWGLRQMRLSAGSGNADGLDAMVWDETKADGVEGAVMAYRYNQTPWASEKSGASYVWGNNIGFFYKGWIFLEGGTTYTIGSSIDDSCIVRIGDTEVLRQANWGAHPVFGAFTPDETTWYEFEVRMGNGSGGAGAGEDSNTFGLGWNTTGTRTVSASAMQPFLDPGDGSFLRPSADRTMTVVSTKRVSGGVSATVSFTAGLPAGTLRAFWGAADCGTNATAWANSAENLASVTGAATETTVTIPVADPSATPYFRLALVGANGAALWSPLLLLDVSQTLLGVASATTDGDRMTVSGAALSLGSGDGYALRLLWGYAADLSDATVTNLSVAAAGAFDATVPVVPGTNGWWRLVATTSDGGYDATLPAAFKTKAGSVLAATATSTMNHHDVTVSGNLDVLGAGVTTVTLWAGEDPEHMTAVGGASASAILDGTGPFSLTGTIPGQVPHSFSWKIVSVNVAPGGTAWTNETSVFTATTVDAATYTWKPEKTEGRWDDPENWTASGVPDLTDVLGYPDNAKAKVRFLADTTATIAVTNAFVFADMSFKYANLAVTFVGTNAATCKLTGDVTNVANDQNDGTVVSGTHVVLSGVTLHDSSGAFNWATKTSEDCVLRLEDGAILSMDGWMHVFGTNTWVEVVEGSRIAWRNPTSTGAGFDLCNYGGGIRLDDGEMNPPHLVPQRHVGAVGPDQFVEIAGDSRFQCGVYFRTWDNNQDKMLNDVDFVFSVPLKGWKTPADAPVYAEYDRTANDRKFAYRSPVGEGKIVLSVGQHSPLLQSGHARTVQLLAWKAGIDTENVRLEQRKGVDMYYTYGWPSTRAAPDGNEIPTGVAARVTGLGGTIMILR